MNPRPRLYLRGRVWRDASLDKIFIVEHLYRKKDTADELVAKVVDGHFIERQETQAEPGRHAGVAANAQ